eukprot:CAMPEP_0201485470 /NCGR_PEP_ID=MMETSP0151_2-20130828/9569_1 /ASSEMBLY_ACC=CAM_ASM_000257 /TAXON_ID=200890 /ORGANISM="Paramoeba atlantica, Strain 621/1 / CCAP 1560/9" /LENGTH=58 /DNA_ID=CAMNT_0047869603 /DNA_START=302 /DNA_END=475 /DNA_ORIENTATION=+
MSLRKEEGGFLGKVEGGFLKREMEKKQKCLVMVYEGLWGLKKGECEKELKKVLKKVLK